MRALLIDGSCRLVGASWRERTYIANSGECALGRLWGSLVATMAPAEAYAFLRRGNMMPALRSKSSRYGLRFLCRYESSSSGVATSLAARCARGFRDAVCGCKRFPATPTCGHENAISIGNIAVDPRNPIISGAGQRGASSGIGILRKIFQPPPGCRCHTVR